MTSTRTSSPSFKQDRSADIPCLSQSEAPAQVVDDIAATEGQSTHSNGFQASPSPPNSQANESLSPELRQELEMLQELIKRKLEGAKP